MNKKELSTFVHKRGVNCESNTIRDLLAFDGVELSEPMIIGLCEGYSFVYLNLKNFGFPFVGGRTKDQWLDLFTKNTGITFNILETSSEKKAEKHLIKNLKSNRPVGLGVDYYYLEYIPVHKRVHFIGHTVSVAGYDEKGVYVGERDYEALQFLSWESLKKARASKVRGLGSPKHLAFTVESTQEISYKQVLPEVLYRMADRFLNPPFGGAGYRGLEKLTKAIIKDWPIIEKEGTFKGVPFHGWAYVADMWDVWGTGGAIFRNPLRDFLKEASELLIDDRVKKAYEMYSVIAERYEQMTAIMRSMDKRASNSMEVFEQLASLATKQLHQEKEAMRLLLTIKE